MNQFIKFFILGAFSTLIDFIVYTILVYSNIGYVIAIGIGYGCGFIFNFYIGRRHIFRDGIKVKNFTRELLVVLIINLVAVLLNIFIVYILYSYLSILGKIYARIIAIGIVFFWNYYARKLFVYH
jgi:putative flippase GtrA